MKLKYGEMKLEALTKFGTNIYNEQLLLFYMGVRMIVRMMFTRSNQKIMLWKSYLGYAFIFCFADQSVTDITFISLCKKTD